MSPFAVLSHPALWLSFSVASAFRQSSVDEGDSSMHLSVSGSSDYEYGDCSEGIEKTARFKSWTGRDFVESYEPYGYTGKYVLPKYKKGKKYRYVVVNLPKGECANNFMFYPPAKDYVLLQRVRDSRNYHKANGYMPEYFCAIEGSGEDATLGGPEICKKFSPEFLEQKKKELMESCKEKLCKYATTGKWKATLFRWKAKKMAWNATMSGLSKGYEDVFKTCEWGPESWHNLFPDLKGFAESYGMINAQNQTFNKMACGCRGPDDCS
eukprot:Skav215320  [mRNA]  locus=scaffold2444:334741:335541:+ [translate_table: standard]